jgi:two-component system OmpR family response regulator
MNSILIVDGDKEYREFLVDFFKKREFDAVCCANYEQAWTLAAGKIFDIAVIDYFIGGQNGGALCEALTNRDHGATALIITSDTQSNAIELSIRQHSPAFLFVKPFIVDNLYAVALKILEARDKKKLRTRNMASVC